MPDDMDRIQDNEVAFHAAAARAAMGHAHEFPDVGCVPCGGVDGLFAERCPHYSECLKDFERRRNARRISGR